MIKIKKTTWRWVAPALLLVVAACAGPPPPVGSAAVPTSGAAIVHGGPAKEMFLFGRGNVTVTRVDDTVLVDENNNPLYRNIEVTAGRHAVYFHYRYAALCVRGSACAMTLSREQKIALNAEAGHVYRVGASYRAGRLWFWITDQSDGQRLVSGDLPDGDDWATRTQGFRGNL